MNTFDDSLHQRLVTGEIQCVERNHELRGSDRADTVALVPCVCVCSCQKDHTPD